MRKLKQLKRIRLIGAILILSGLPSVVLENNTWLHNISQISFVVGCFMYLYSGKLKKTKSLQSLMVFLLIFSFTPQVSAQDYGPQVKAFENSFYQKDISIIKPFLSDSLRFDPLSIQNTIPVLTNIVTKLPRLNKIKIQDAEKGRSKVKYDFEQLGVSESDILFDSDGKIWKIEFVENLVKQQIEQQQKLKSSVQMPKPDKVSFDHSKKAVEFPSKDGLIISGELFEVDRNKPVVLLCHQAGYNKYEYADIAPRLNKMGYNALAIDQRSGGTFAGKMNETHERAVKNGYEEIGFTDAIQDIEAAIAYLTNRYQQKTIVWGSSYSASLVLHIAAVNNNVKAVISFSPGDYFGDELASLNTIFPKLKQPFFITSSQEEAVELKKLIQNKKQNELQLQFIPTSEGFHGSRALWIDQKGADEYWLAVSSFLKKVK